MCPCLRCTGGVLRRPVRRHLQGGGGGDRKASCVFERNRKTKKEGESGGPTGMPVKIATFGVSTTISAALRLLFTSCPPASSLLLSPLLPSCCCCFSLPARFFIIRILLLSLLRGPVCVCVYKILTPMRCTCQLPRFGHIRQLRADYFPS